MITLTTWIWLLTMQLYTYEHITIRVSEATCQHYNKTPTLSLEWSIEVNERRVPVNVVRCERVVAPLYSVQRP